MKRIARAIIVGGFVYAIGWALASQILPKKAPHTWFRVKVDLANMGEFAANYTSDHGAPPNATELNKKIEKAWVAKDLWRYSDPTESDDNLWMILAIVSGQTELRRFEQAPRYIVDSTLPDGFGFYSAGEDNTSTSNGRDPDDINSWDKSSDNFYYERYHRKTSLRNFVVAIPCALIAGWLVGKKKK